MTDKAPPAPKAIPFVVYNGTGGGGDGAGNGAGKPYLAGLEDVKVLSADELFAEPAACISAAILLVDASMLDHAADLARLPSHLVVVAADDAAEQALGERADLSLAGMSDPADRQRILRTAGRFSAVSLSASKQRRELVCARRDLHKLKTMGMQLMDERDPAALLRGIVEEGKVLTESDAGLLFLLEKDRSNQPRLRLAMYHWDSLPDLPVLTSESLAVDDTSVIGHSAVVRHQVVVEDAYAIPPDAGFMANKDFDAKYGYRSRSMLLVPMLDRHGGVVGVLAFVNRKRHSAARIHCLEDADRYVLPYTRREVRMARALAGLAASSIENSALYARIEHIFESFVKAAVSAIDQRDPSTAGHSVRVATLTTELAKAVQRGGNGPYKNLRLSHAQMRELHFAALLHDLGKVGVREDVLMKGKRLPAQLWERVEARFDLIRRTLEAEHYKNCPGAAETAKDSRTLAGPMDPHCAEQLKQLDRLWEIVRAANDPAPPFAAPSDLDDIGGRMFEGLDGKPAPYLTSDELRYLQIPHGTLNPHEREEIQSHVEQTYQFLLQIPWTDELKDLALIAYGHHEKLDGSGYPRRIKGDQIPVQTRIMTIADIFDALTASDRPYKQAVAPDKALDIIQAEAKSGLLDVELVRVLVESQVYTQILR